jgi:hypothetical protein
VHPPRPLCSSFVVALPTSTAAMKP